ncbi:MAG: molybdopterin-dependent oxidoreductase [Candidatus Sumerlaeia bacterium]|nr:molybdopterin-dependent oxidoreductase [Candidatus Sumerlaeia bacterium]
MADQSVHPALKPGDEEIKLVINGKEVVGKKGETIISVAAREDYYIPHYCWHPALSVAGNCRLCLVEIHLPNPRNDNKLAPLPKPAIACQTPITEGMHVFTDSQLAKECQEGMMEFLLVNHPLDCPICDRGGECMLQRYSMEYGTPHTRMRDPKRKYLKPEADPLIDIERNRCIMCTRCVRFCDEVAGEHVMGVFARGSDNYIGTFGQGPVANILSGNVIDLCPVGCLTSKPFRFKARVWELLQTQSTSIWDASGSKVTHWTRNGRLYRTTPPSRKYHGVYTVNEDTEEFIDNITRFGSDFPSHENRWDESRVKFGENLLPAAFTEAVRRVATGLKKVADEHGPDSLAILVSPRSSMEEGYLAQKLARDVIGTENIDWRVSFQTAEAAEAAAQAFQHANGDLEDGFDAVVVLNGDYLHSVPAFAMRLKEHARLTGKPIVQIGHHHDAFLAPHSKYKFHCAPGSTAKALQLLSKGVGGDTSVVSELAKIFSTESSRVEALITLLKGVEGRGLVLQSLEDLNGLLLPNEVPAALAFVGALGGGWKYIPTLRDRNAFGLHAVGAQPKADAEGKSVNARQLADAIEDGTIKGLLVLGADALHHSPDRERLLASLGKLDFYAVSDLFDSDYTRIADVYLAAASHLEKDGTFCDVEGNLARLASTEGLVGGARPEWEMLTGIATIMGSDNFAYETVEDVFKEMMSVIAPDFKGTFKKLLLAGPRNDNSIKDPGGARTHTKDYNPGDYRTDGAHFRWTGEPVAIDDQTAAPRSVPESGFDGFLLTWGEHVQGDDYHLNHASIVELLQKAPYVELNPVDAVKLGAETGDRGTLDINGESYEVELKVCEGPAPGVVYLPAGLGGIKLSGLTDTQAVKLEVVKSNALAEAGAGNTA